MRQPIEAHQDGQTERGLAALEGLMQRGTQIGSQFLANQLGDVAGQWAARRLEKTACIFGQMDRPVRLVDENARRRLLLQRQAMQSRLAGCGRASDGARNVRGMLGPSGCAEQFWKGQLLVARAPRRLVDASFPVDGAKQTGRALRAFGRAEEQETVGVQGIMEDAADLLLKLAIEIDEQVAARDEIEPGEWRVLEQAVAGEQDRVPKLSLGPVVVSLPREKAAKTLLADVGLDRDRVSALASNGKPTGIQIGTENLDLRADVVARRFLQEQHRDRVGLLARGTAGHPYANGVARLLALEEPRYDMLGQSLERFRISEECRHRNQQITEQRLHLLHIVAEEREIVRQLFSSRHLGAARDPSQHRRFLVLREVVTGAAADVGENAAHVFFIRVAQLPERDMFLVPRKLDNARGYFAEGQDEVGEPRGDRAARHRSVFGLVRVLHEDDAACFLDRLEADRAIRAGAREDDGEAIAVLLGERPEEKVDRRSSPSRTVEFVGRNLVIGNSQVPIRRNDIDVIGLQGSRFINLRNGHAGPRRKNSRQLAVALGRQMHNYHKGNARTVGQSFEERLQRLDAARGGANSDDRRFRARLLRLGALLFVRVAVFVAGHGRGSKRVFL